MRPIAIHVLLFSLLLCSCKKNSKSIPDKYISIDSTINMTMQETLASSYMERHLQLKFATDRLYNCGDTIVYTFSRTGDTFNIIFSSVLEPGACLTRAAGATANGLASLDFGNLSNGTYYINITNRVQNPCTLTVDSGEYIFTRGNTNGLSHTMDTLIRVADNVIWGYLGTNSSNNAWIIPAFIDSLMGHGAQSIPIVPGNNFAYNYYLVDSQICTRHAFDGYYYSKSFVYHYSGDFSPILNLIQSFKGQSQNSVVFNVANDKGQYGD